MPAAFIRFEDLNVDDTEDEIQDKEDCCDGHIRYD
jgi:hypothetical protein